MLRFHPFPIRELDITTCVLETLYLDSGLRLALNTEIVPLRGDAIVENM